MRVVAWVLVLACVALYSFDSFRAWLQEDVAPVNEERVAVTVFPEAMKNIRPIDNPDAYIHQRQEVARIQAQKVAEAEKIRLENERQAALAKAQEKPTLKPLPEAIQAQARAQSKTDFASICLRTSILSQKALPAINRSLQSAGLLEAFQIESELSADRYVVFIVPSATRKGAEILARQIKKQGFASARVITEGPLHNAVQLGSFNSEQQAQTYLEESAKKLDMTALRVSRIIGKATGRVSLVFANINEKQEQSLRRIAQQHGFKLASCY